MHIQISIYCAYFAGGKSDGSSECSALNKISLFELSGISTAQKASSFISVLLSPDQPQMCKGGAPEDHHSKFQPISRKCLPLQTSLKLIYVQQKSSPFLKKPAVSCCAPKILCCCQQLLLCMLCFLVPCIHFVKSLGSFLESQLS